MSRYESRSIHSVLHRTKSSTSPKVYPELPRTIQRRVLLEASTRLEQNQFPAFRRNFFAKRVPNVCKLGLFEANGGFLREKWGEAGLLEFEFASDTSSDYESYDEVAKDRATIDVAAGDNGIT